jgi:NAD(P)-dependent dehydrogenase (short-subunit alcohol dehydrogenase family)
MSSNFAFDAAGKVVVVTGGGRGIGAGIVDAFARQHGAKRVYSVSRSTEDTVLKPSTASGGEIVGVSADLSTPDGAAKVASTIAARGDDLVHVLVHNSGASWGAELESHNDEGFVKTYQLNVMGTWRLTVALLPHLMKAGTPQDPARVIVIGSIAGIRPQKYPTFSYDASKAALHHLALKLADEFARKRALDITVNVVAPGYIPTKMSAGLTKYGESSDDIVASSVPLRRAGAPADVAGAVAFLSSDAAAWITGVVLPVDGGFLAKL